MFIIVGHYTEFGFNGFNRKAGSSLERTESFTSSEKHMQYVRLTMHAIRHCIVLDNDSGSVCFLNPQIVLSGYKHFHVTMCPDTSESAMFFFCSDRFEY